jgi:LPS sulfotransferase NodH
MNFIVLAAKRTGSTMVVSFLDKQPNISCESEIFRVAGINWPYSDKSWVLDWRKKNKKHALLARYKDPLSFINFIKEKQTNAKKTLFGFKLFGRSLGVKKFNFNHNLLQLLKDNNCKVIILHRNNEFLRTLSEYRGEITNQYVLFDKQTNKIVKPYHFDVKKYFERKENIKKTYDRVKLVFEKYGIIYKMYSYEDITGPNKQAILKDMTVFIGQPVENYIQYQDNIVETKKQNVYNIESQIKNFKEVSAKLKNDKDFISALANEQV